MRIDIASHMHGQPWAHGHPKERSGASLGDLDAEDAGAAALEGA